MKTTGRKCIECGEETYHIQIIDRGQNNIHYELMYADEGAKRKFYSGVETAGKVSGEMCQNCGRITLRAVPEK